MPADRVDADRAEHLVDEAKLVAEQVIEDERDGDGSHHEWEEHAHAPERLRPQVVVEHRRDEESDHDLRYRREQEDAERVAQRDPEVGLRQHGREVLEADELALAADEVPVMERDPRRVDEWEQAHEREEDEKGRDVEVGRDPHIPVTESLAESDATDALLLGCGGHGAPWVDDPEVRGSGKAGWPWFA